MPEHAQEEATAFAQNVASMVRSRPGRLAALTVRLPAELGAEFATLLAASLSDAGIDLVDITTTRGPGAPRIVAMEFER